MALALLPSRPMRSVAPMRASSTAVDSEQPTASIMDTPAFKVWDMMFNIPVIHDVLFGVYRKQVEDKAHKMGLEWRSYLNELKADKDVLLAKQKEITDPAVKIPSYYFAPIHAYADGNLCWDSAMEEDLWSKMMIAPLYNNALDGDVKLRNIWMQTIQRNVGDVAAVRKATDLGCGTGLSMFTMTEYFDKVEDVTGVDLSTYKLAISMRKMEQNPEIGNKINLIHAPAEGTPLESGSQDLVTLCLVCHESPEWVSNAIFKEAYRITKPGGYFSVLDLERENLEAVLANPFVAAVYKRTEPYMRDFLELNMPEAMEKAGFVVTDVVRASKSHSAIVGRKPLDA